MLILALLFAIGALTAGIFEFTNFATGTHLIGRRRSAGILLAFEILMIWALLFAP